MITKIVIGADHRGFVYKQKLVLLHVFDALAIEWIDVGTYDGTRSDYPHFAARAALHIQAHTAEYGILLCGSGTGMALAANRFVGVYASVVWDVAVAHVVKADDNCNVLCIPVDFITFDQTVACITAWLQTAFKGGVYQQRLELVDTLARKQ